MLGSMGPLLILQGGAMTRFFMEQDGASPEEGQKLQDNFVLASAVAAMGW